MIIMDFTNQNNPFMSIYKDMLNKLYTQYIYHAAKNYQSFNPAYAVKPEAKASSIDDIVSRDSIAVLDKLKNSSLAIAYRIRINGTINNILDYNWYCIRKDMVNMDIFYPIKSMGTERKKSTLISELFKVYKTMIDEKKDLWKDLNEEMRYFIHLFHSYNQLKQDKKLLTEG